jgi:hypothetical protein
MTPETVTARLIEYFSGNPPFRDLEAILYRIMDTFRQVGRASTSISAAATESEEVAAAAADDARQPRDDPEFDFE